MLGNRRTQMANETKLFRNLMAENIEEFRARSKAVEDEGKEQLHRLTQQIRYMGAECIMPHDFRDDRDYWMACVDSSEPIRFRNLSDNDLTVPQIHGTIAGPGRKWKDLCYVNITVVLKNAEDDATIMSYRYEYDERQVSCNDPHPWFHTHVGDNELPRLPTKPIDFFFAGLTVVAQLTSRASTRISLRTLSLGQL